MVWNICYLKHKVYIVYNYKVVLMPKIRTLLKLIDEGDINRPL